MRHGLTRAAALVCTTLTLSACNSVPVDLWPFSGDKELDTTRAPAGATTYQCDGGKRLFVRYLDDNAAAWVILPGREFRLNKTASASGSRYSNGSATLEINGSEAALRDGDIITHANCKNKAS